MAKPFELIVTDGTNRFEEVIDRARSNLAHIKNGFAAAVSRSMNRAATSGRAAAITTIREDFYVKAGVVRKHFGIEKATRESLETVVSVRGSPLAVDAFLVRPRHDTTGRNRKPVRIAIKRGSAAKPISRAFIHKGRVLRRLGKSSKPLKAVYGPAVPMMADTERVRDRATEALNTTFIKRLEHEVDRVLLKGVENRKSKQ